MISVEQMRAARALLNWKQSDLARESGVSLASINNIEREISSPRLDTMVAIEMAMYKAGIEFLGQDGLRKHKEAFAIKELQGKDFIKEWMDDFTSCMTGPEDMLLVCGLDEREFPKHAPDQLLRFDEHHKKTGFQERIMIKEGDNFLTGAPECYRWISHELIGAVPYLVYKDRYVIAMYEAKRIIIIRNQSIADNFRKQFEFLWQLGKKLPDGLVNKLDDPAYLAKLAKK
jgi:transcriptional regulator with XRE-family HTH domain